MYSNSDFKPYLATAGHCMYGGTWYEQFSSDLSFHPVGPSHSASFGDASTDVRILTVNNPAGWRELNNYVVVYEQSTGGYPTSYNTAYTITAQGSPTVTDIYICHSGATSGTHCGRITNDRAMITYDGQLIQDLFQVQGTSCTGDSGGPAYVNHTAYGIEVAYSGLTSHNYTITGANGVNQTCNPDYWYVTKIGDFSAVLNASPYLG